MADLVLWIPGALLREPRRGRADHGERLWVLLVLEDWRRRLLERRLEPAR